MELFSEIYGVYYKIVEEILAKSPVTRTKIEQTVGSMGFAETALELIPKLIQEDGWGLLELRERQYFSTLSSKPHIPLTSLEKSWLKSVLSDPRARLFISDEALEALLEHLKDTEPLYSNKDFIYFDRYADGDSFEDEMYIRHFRLILHALKEKHPIKIVFNGGPRNGGSRTHIGHFIPVRLEYSSKDDKFRVYCIRVREGKFQDYALINIGRVLDVKESNEIYTSPVDIEEFLKNIRCDEPLMVEIRPERNAIERFMVEFSTYEKQSELDEETGCLTATVYYNKTDETEVLIKILSFGPVVKVLSPNRFIDLAKERIQKQSRLMEEHVSLLQRLKEEMI